MEQKRKAVAVCIPHTGTVTSEWCWRFRHLQLPPSSVVLWSRGSPIDVCRNDLVKDALNSGFEWIFFLDSDILVDSDVVYKLMANNLPICAGLYRAKKKEGFCYAAWLKVKDGYAPIAEWQGTLIPVDVTGLGCCLIHSEVFRRVEPPWFKWEGISEDFYFFEKAKKHGYQCMIDTTVKCAHVATLKIKPENGETKRLDV